MFNQLYVDIIYLFVLKEQSFQLFECLFFSQSLLDHFISGVKDALHLNVVSRALSFSAPE